MTNVHAKGLGRPVVVGEEDDTAHKADVLQDDAIDEKIKKGLEVYTLEAKKLQRFRRELSAIPRKWTTLWGRIELTLDAHKNSRNIRGALASWLDEEQIHELVLWQIEAGRHFPQMRTRKPYVLTEHLCDMYCHRYSKQICWKKGAMQLLHARAMFSIRHDTKLIVRYLKMAVTESNRWVEFEEVHEGRLLAIRKCALLKKNIAFLYLELSNREWVLGSEFRQRASSQLRQAIELLECEGSDPHAAESIKMYMQKVGLMPTPEQAATVIEGGAEAEVKRE
jgi:hypothetical protein